MSQSDHYLTNEQLLDVFTQTKTATAIHIGEDAVIQTANDAMLAIWGKNKSVFGKSLEDALPELKGQPFIDMFRTVWLEGLTISGTDTAADLVIDGELKTFYFDFEYRAIKKADGQTLCILHSATDVTERYLKWKAIEDAQEKAEALEREQALNEELAAANEELGAINEELRQTQQSLSEINDELEKRVEDRVKELSESEARFRTMAEGTDVFIAVGDETSNATYFNKAWTDLTGRTMGELLEFGWADLIHPDDRDRYLKIYLTAFEKRAPFTGEFRILDTTGNYRWLLANGPPRFNTDGTFAGYISSCIDITERKNHEEQKQQVVDELQNVNEELVASNEELAETQTNLQQTFDSLKMAEQQLRSVVESAPFPIGVYEGREMKIILANQSILDAWGKGNDVVGKTYAEVLPELDNQEIYQQLDGVLNTGVPYHARNQRVDLVIEGKLTPFYFNYSFTPVFDAANNVYAVMNTAADVTDLVTAKQKIEQNEAATRQALLRSNEAIEQFQLAIASANLGTWSVDLNTTLLTISVRGRVLHGLKADEQITLTESMQMVLPEYRDKLESAMNHAIAQNETFEFEYEIQPRDGSASKWLRSTGKTYLDADGKPAHVTGTMLDITDRKQEEQRKDDFISVASHELKTPVTALKAALQLLDRMKANPSSSMMPKLIEQSNKSVEKITTLINELLNTSRISEGQLQLVKNKFKLSDMLDACCNDVRVSGKHELVFEGDGNMEVYADEHRIDQVVVNIVNNAVKYASGSDKIYFGVEKIGDMAKISIRDTGPGISPDKVPHLFSRYYRADYTGTHYSGLGLGLYISAEIIRRHGGQIGVNSELGKGSTFWFTLPMN